MEFVSSQSLDAKEDAEEQAAMVRFCLKWSGETYRLQMMQNETFQELRLLIEMETGVRPENQKIFGLKLRGGVPDEALLKDLALADGKVIKMMGSVDETIEETLANESNMESMLLDDMDWDTTLDEQTQAQLLLAQEALNKTIQKTRVNLMNQPREGKKLLVLDLDHTLLDFDSKHSSSMHELKRPFMDDFLAACYKHYDLVVWSQTKWHWVEIKLTEMGMVTSPTFSICFALDRSCMFKVTREHRGEVRTHEVKALDIIWSKFPHWNAKNTVHIDDLSRNFAMNPQSGLQCSAYRRKRSRAAHDRELLELAAYLEYIATEHDDFTRLDHKSWKTSLQRIVDKQSKSSSSSSSSST